MRHLNNYGAAVAALCVGPGRLRYSRIDYLLVAGISGVAPLARSGPYARTCAPTAVDLYAANGLTERGCKAAMSLLGHVVSPVVHIGKTHKSKGISCPPTRA